MAAVFLILGLLVGAGAVWLWARTALRAAEEKLALVQDAQDGWEDRVKATTGDVLLRSQASLLELADARLGPIRETLQRFEQQSKALEERRLGDVSRIAEQLRFVAEGQEKLRAETGSLVTALRTPHVRGRWGEVQLKRVVEHAGMLDHCDFRTQASERDLDGRLLRPDLVVQLPGGKSIVVDSKVPIEAYLHATGTEDVEARRGHLARHAGQVRDHVVKLGQKRYWQQFDPSPEFVVMFVDEGLYRAALDQDPSLFEAGVDAGVIIASPATLVALLRTVAYTWQQETVAESARAISRLGRELYDRLGVFADHFAKVGRGLETAVGAYNHAASSFESRLLVTARKFPEHGVTAAELSEPKQVEKKPVVVSASELVALPPSSTMERDADAA
jgi:DNA recombination protein RmuC